MQRQININDYLNKDEIKILVKKSNWKASWLIFYNWLVIGLTFTMVAFFTNVFTIILALFILGGRQLSCAITMHDASHRALFTSHKANDFFGNWLAAYPIMMDATRYRPYHIKHHVNTGTHKDPDLSLTKGYPTTVISFCRKVFRDLTGQSGLKAQLGVFLMNTGYIKYNLGGLIEKISQKRRNFTDILKVGVYYYWKPMLVNIILWTILWSFGFGWLYLLWIGALLTTYNFMLRVRSIAEHSVVPNTLDNYQNTRTTKANILEKLFFAPNNVNYHCEHHLLMTVPPYNLPKMHKIIKERGFYEKGLLVNGYWRIIKLAISKI